MIFWYHINEKIIGGYVLKRKKSFVRAIFSYLLIVMILIILILGLFLGSSFHVLKNEIYTSSDSFLDIYENELENDIAKMDSIFKNITTQGEDLAKIKSNQENEREHCLQSAYIVI